jgi:hypothetical protein
MQSPLAGNSYISNKADCRRAIYCVTPVTPELDRGLPAWRWIRRSKYGKSVAVLGAGLVGEQEREVIGTLEISYWGITRSRMLGSYGGCTTRITWSKISWPTRRYYLGDFEELMRALRELEIWV